VLQATFRITLEYFFFPPPHHPEVESPRRLEESAFFFFNVLIVTRMTCLRCVCVRVKQDLTSNDNV